MAKKSKSRLKQRNKKQEIIYTTIRLSRCAAGKNSSTFASMGQEMGMEMELKG